MKAACFCEMLILTYKLTQSHNLEDEDWYIHCCENFESHKVWIIFAGFLQYYNMWLSLAGALLCVSVMFLISWWTALITLAFVLALYLIVSYRKPGILCSCTLTQVLR
jgi:hypothetical protein